MAVILVIPVMRSRWKSIWSSAEAVATSGTQVGCREMPPTEYFLETDRFHTDTQIATAHCKLLFMCIGILFVMTFNWNSSSTQPKQTIRWGLRWVDEHIGIDKLLFCGLKENVNILVCNSHFILFCKRRNFWPEHSSDWATLQRTSSAYWELCSTIHQLGPDDELRLSRWDCSAYSLLTRGNWAESQMSAVHL